MYIYMYILCIHRLYRAGNKTKKSISLACNFVRKSCELLFKLISIL